MVNTREEKQEKTNCITTDKRTQLSAFLLDWLCYFSVKRINSFFLLHVKYKSNNRARPACRSACKIIPIFVTQMTMTQYNSSVPQRHQRRLSTVHLDGLSILTHALLALGGREKQQHHSNVLKHALLTPAVLLSIGVMATAAGYMIRIVNENG